MHFEHKIRDFYKDKTSKNPAGAIYDGPKNLYTLNPGIGDSVLMTPFCEHGFSLSSNPKLSEMIEFVPSRKMRGGNEGARVEVFETASYGKGHLIQRIYRALGIAAPIVPKGNLVRQRDPLSRIGVCLTHGASAYELQSINPRPRQFYDENIPIIEEFIKRHSEFEFVELGKESKKINGCHNLCGVSLKQSISELSACQFYIGLNSGFMNVAAALGIPSVIIVNIPRVEQLVLPMLVDCSIPDLNWLYPQNVHLHQDGGTEMVPKFSIENLNKALEGSVYPYWTHTYLNL